MLWAFLNTLHHVRTPQVVMRNELTWFASGDSLIIQSRGDGLFWGKNGDLALSECPHQIPVGLWSVRQVNPRAWGLWRIVSLSTTAIFLHVFVPLQESSKHKNWSLKIQSRRQPSMHRSPNGFCLTCACWWTCWEVWWPSKHEMCVLGGPPWKGCSVAHQSGSMRVMRWSCLSLICWKWVDDILKLHRPSEHTQSFHWSSKHCVH